MSGFPGRTLGTHPSICTPATSGPSFFGSWQNSGCVHFIELMNQIGNNCKNNAAKVKEVDEAMLNFLRKKCNIEEKDADQKKKRKRNEPPPKIAMIDFEDLEDEEEWKQDD